MPSQERVAEGRRIRTRQRRDRLEAPSRRVTEEQEVQELRDGTAAVTVVQRLAVVPEPVPRDTLPMLPLMDHPVVDEDTRPAMHQMVLRDLKLAADDRVRWHSSHRVRRMIPLTSASSRISSHHVLPIRPPIEQSK